MIIQLQEVVRQSCAPGLKGIICPNYGRTRHSNVAIILRSKCESMITSETDCYLLKYEDVTRREEEESSELSYK